MLVRLSWTLITIQVMVPITLQVGIAKAGPVEGIRSHLGTGRYPQAKARPWVRAKATDLLSFPQVWSVGGGRSPVGRSTCSGLSGLCLAS